VKGDLLLKVLGLPEKDRLKLAEALAAGLGMKLVSADGSAPTAEKVEAKPAGEIQRPTGDDLHVWTDGSCLVNPGGPGGWGVVLVPQSGEIREMSGNNPQTTNNKMELTAILEGLKASPTSVKVRVFTDSEYAIKALTVWWKSWMKNDWKTAGGAPAANVELIKAIIEEMRVRKVAFEWVRGHAGTPGNERADALASAAAREAQGAVVDVSAVPQEELAG
jgi:ribonuclease HI